MAGNIAPKVVTDGLVLYLDAANTKSYVSGSTTWNDISKSVNNGVLLNGPTFSSTNGGGIVFDGVDDLFYVPFVLDTSTNFTIETFSKCNTMTSNGTNRQTIWGFTTTTAFAYKVLDLEIWGDGLTSINGDTTSFASSLLMAYSPVNANNINSYVVSKSGTTQSWYINGVFKGSVTQQYTATSEYFKLASRGPSGINYVQGWNGNNYSVRIYNRALSAAEILQNYNATKTRFI
jgi:hypothetical protein